MMESLLKKSYSFSEKKASEKVSLEAPRSGNCNICRNFSNIFDRSHRLSASHQNKLTERFRIIRSKMKMIRHDSIAVHDDQWGCEEDIWCYFCDKSIKKHQVLEGCTVEYLGHLTHLTDFQHTQAVRSYLKYHNRKEKIELFCKTKADLEKFLSKFPEAKNKYLAKLNFIHKKDVAHIKEVEAERQLLVSEVLKGPITVNKNEASTSGNEMMSQKAGLLPQNIPHKQKANLNPKPKICPWLLESEKECNDQQTSQKPVIGPTMDTLKKHVSDQKKKMLPVKRLGAKIQRKHLYSSHWLPSFSGVWNKGRHRHTHMKSNNKNSR